MNRLRELSLDTKTKSVLAAVTARSARITNVNVMILIKRSTTDHHENCNRCKMRIFNVPRGHHCHHAGCSLTSEIHRTWTFALKLDQKSNVQHISL